MQLVCEQMTVSKIGQKYRNMLTTKNSAAATNQSTNVQRVTTTTKTRTNNERRWSSQSMGMCDAET